eukprot:3765989-Ditylum_brightwellii.AAC.1
MMISQSLKSSMNSKKAALDEALHGRSKEIDTIDHEDINNSGRVSGQPRVLFRQKVSIVSSEPDDNDDPTRNTFATGTETIETSTCT